MTWLSGTDENLLYLSVLTLGEIRKGVAMLKEPARRVQLETWLDSELRLRFAGIGPLVVEELLPSRIVGGLELLDRHVLVGVAVVLGKAGMNFGAGMTGGLAWVYDTDGSFVSAGRFHPDFIIPESFAVADATSQADLKALIEQHVMLTDSGLAKAMLANWEVSSQAFVRLTPKRQA